LCIVKVVELVEKPKSQFQMMMLQTASKVLMLVEPNQISAL
jgi:hypothetical protein